MTEAAVVPKIPSVVRVLSATRPLRFRMLLYGETKLGKSTFGSRLHSPAGRSLLIPTTRGFEALDGASLLIDRQDNPMDLAGLDKAMALVPWRDFDAVVLDDLQGLLSMIQAEVASRFNKDNFDEVNPKQAWPALRQRLFGFTHDLEQRARNIVYVSREKLEMSKDEDPRQQKVERIRPDVAPSLLASIAPDVDIVGRAYPGLPTPENKTPGTLLTCRPTQVVIAGCRWPGIFDAPIPLDGALFWTKFFAAPPAERKA